MDRRTKIVATVGPACDDDAALGALLGAGVDVVRLNLAHGTPEDQVARLHRVRRVADELGLPVAVLADLPGPKVRTAPFPDGGVFLAEGDILELVPSDGVSPSSRERIGVDYASLCDDAADGESIVLGDGATSLRVEACRPDGLLARVISGGRLHGRPGVHLPAGRLRIATPTATDLALLDVIVAAGADLVAISFVRQAADVARVRDALAASGTTGPGGPGGHAPMLVAKIETRAAVDDLGAIMDVADALMVARGDLGADCPIEEVPHLQKRIVRACVEWGRPVITATQMLESMIHSPAPTRAEASDVANAVFDGTDAVMLSAETAIGRDPAHVVRTMARIVGRAEMEADYLQWGRRLGRLQRTHPLPETLAITAATTHAAWEVAVELGVRAVLCWTRSGLTARAMARFRPPCQLISLSPSDVTARQLALSWGVTPLRVDEHPSVDELVWFAVETAVRDGLVDKGDVVVVVAGSPEEEVPSTDALRVVRVR